MRTTTTGRPTRRPAPTLLAAVLGGAALVVAAPLAAQAHVSVGADSTAAGSYALLTLSVPHGCEGSPTTKVAVRIPAGINTVTPSVNPGWTVAKKDEKLAAPVTTEGGEKLTSRVAEVVWTARTPLADGYRDALSLQVQLPEGAAGTQLAFPTLQTCTEGETAWIQVPAAGQDHDAVEHPAPTLQVTAAETEAHGTAATTTEAAAPPDEHAAQPVAVQADVSAATSGGAVASGSGLGVAGLVMGALGLAAGTTALVRSRPTQTRP